MKLRWKRFTEILTYAHTFFPFIQADNRPCATSLRESLWLLLKKQGLRRDEFLLIRASYDLGPLNLDGKKLHFFFFSLTCIWKIAFPSILSVGNKFLLYEQYLCLCHQQKLAILISFYGCCNMLKYCLHISLPKKYEVIRPSLDLGI